jgi:hypothetical protein
MKSVKPRKGKLLKFAEEMTSGSVPVDAATATLIESQSEEAREPAPVAAAPVEAAAVATPPKAVMEEPARRAKAPGGVFVLGLMVLLTMIAGPPLLLAMSALAYPAVLLVVFLAGWKIFDLFQDGA